MSQGFYPRSTMVGQRTESGFYGESTEGAWMMMRDLAAGHLTAPTNCQWGWRKNTQEELDSLDDEDQPGGTRLGGGEGAQTRPRQARSVLDPTAQSDLDLTEKGRSVASRLAEIQLLLSERKHPAPNHRLANLSVARKLTEDDTLGIEEKWRSSRRGSEGKR